MRRVPLVYLPATLALGLLLLEPLTPQQSPGETVKQLRTAPGLEITLWAAEPDVLNPTNMDIDERGRIWITEAVNYRRRLHQEPDYREEGDRITILEDTNGDGRADRVKVFAQDPSLRSPLGIAVLGNKVLVSQSPDIIVFTKDDDDNILRREVFLTGWGGEDHDHGVHAVVYGPDGYYYFNNGDSGLDVTDRSGRRIASGPDREYYAGSALRARPDGTGLEVLGHNFRNPYELAIDSFGYIWQSDNDDDGYESTRINYVMEGGNHGFWGPEGRRWREDRGTHWHEEDPGVVPTLLRTGAGSPCGIVAYEGKLLPERYWGKLLHVDNGPRVLRSYDVRPEGAGFRASMEVVVEGLDTWFRPSDLVVAHDGAVFIADWYDPVVGGHQMKDIERGRIYRLAPPGHRTARPEVDLATARGRAEALASPAQSVRYLAHQRFLQMGASAVSELAALSEAEEPVQRARALWLLGSAGPAGLEYARREMESPDPRFRVLAVRILKQHHPEFVNVVEPLLRDPSPQVRRQIALSLRDAPVQEALEPLVELARQYDGKDRWYLEALAIGARGKENALYRHLADAFPAPWDHRFGSLLWVLRPSEAVEFLKRSARDESLDPAARRQALEALGVQPSPDVGPFLADLVTGNQPPEVRDAAAQRLVKQLFSLWRGLRGAPEIVPALRETLRLEATRLQALDLIGELGDPHYREDLLQMAADTNLPLEVRLAAVETVGRLKGGADPALLDRLLGGDSPELQAAALRALGWTADEAARGRLRLFLLSEADNQLRSEAVRALGRTDEGRTMLLDLAKAGQLPEELRGTATLVVNASRQPDVQQRARQLLPMFTTRTAEMLSNPRDFLLRFQGRAEEGREVFFGVGQCAVCHNVDGGPEKMGPDLGTIGDKLGREGLLESIIDPSAGIAPEYAVWILQTRSAGELRGRIADETPESITIQDLAGERRTVAKSEILERQRDPVSAMPNLVGLLTEQELADLIEYMAGLRRGGS